MDSSEENLSLQIVA